MTGLSCIRPDVLNIKYKNKFTIVAKHMSPTEIAIDEDNSEQLDNFYQKTRYVT